MNLLAQAPNFENIQRGAGLLSLGTLTPGSIVTKALPFVFGAVGLLLLVYLVLGGLQLMTSRGDPKAVAAAQAKITSALIGFVIVLLSAGVVVILGRILKVDVFSKLF